MRRQHPDSSLTHALAIIALLLIAPFASAQTSPQFHFGGFADATFSHDSDTKHNDLDFGEVDLYANRQLSDAWSVFAEGLVQRAASGSDADAGKHQLEAELERLYAAYSRSDSFRLEAGRVYTGIIAWNEREAQGRFLQTPIDVPAIARRQEQGGAWPLHFVGAWMTGNIPGAEGLHYGAGIGQSRSRTVDDVALFSRSGSPAALLSLSFEPDRTPGLRLGAAVLRDTIPAPEGRYRETDRTLSMSYLNGPLEIRSEWSRMDHRLHDAGPAFVTQGWYALVSMRLHGRAKTFRPYVLLDHLDVAEGEAYVAGIRGLHAWSAGTRWDVARHVAVKADYRSEKRPSLATRDALRVQLAISF